MIIGATSEGGKEPLGFQVEMRESAPSWREHLVDVKARRLALASGVSVGDGASGYWNTLDEAFPSARH